MKDRTLGKTDIQVSELTLGTWGLASGAYGEVSDKDFERTVETAREEGITTFDLAPLWGDGRSERVVAKAIGAKRDECVYITRGGAALEDDRVAHRFDPASLRADCEASLERLETDRIDLWLLHVPPSHLYATQPWSDAVEALKKEEKIRAWGASVSDAADARRAIGAGAEVLVLPHHLLSADTLADIAEEIETAECGVLVRSPLLHGLLTGTWSEGRSFPEEDHRSARWTARTLRLRVRQLHALNYLVKGDVLNLTSAALRFALSNPLVAGAIVGARTPEQVRSAVKHVDIDTEPPYLAPEDIERLAQVLSAAGA